MTIEESKNIKLADYLHSLGYNPVKQQGSSLWYKSPFREEKEPSFKVNPDRNLWYDFGLGKGGNIIALAQELYASDSVPYLLDKIAQRSITRPSCFFLFSAAIFYTAEFSAVGSCAAFFSCLVFLLAGEGDKYGTGKKRM